MRPLVRALGLAGLLAAYFAWVVPPLVDPTGPPWRGIVLLGSSIVLFRLLGRFEPAP